MRQLSLVVVGMSLVVLSLAVSAPAAEVTIKGVMMCEICCTRDLAREAAREAEKTLVLFAVEGTPEVSATLDGIMKEYYSGDSIDADQARKIQEGFEKSLKYYTAAAMKSPYNIPYKAFEWKVKATQCGCPVVRYERWDHCWTPTCGRNWRKDDAKSGMLVSGGV